MNLVLLGWRTSIYSYFHLNIKIIDNSSGTILTSRNIFLESGYEAGYFIEELPLSILKSKEYRIVITSYI